MWFHLYPLAFLLFTSLDGNCGRKVVPGRVLIDGLRNSTCCWRISEKLGFSAIFLCLSDGVGLFPAVNIREQSHKGKFETLNTTML